MLAVVASRIFLLSGIGDPLPILLFVRDGYCGIYVRGTPSHYS